MNLSLESAVMTARELRRSVTRLTSHLASRSVVYARNALRLVRSARNPGATLLKLRARNREPAAVEAAYTSLANSVFVTVGDRDRPLSLCNTSTATGGISVERFWSDISTRDWEVAELGPKPVRLRRTAPRRLFETAVAGDCTSAFDFKSLRDLSSDLAATFQQIRIDTGALKESATGNVKLRSANRPSALNMNNDQCIESASDTELCVLILTETASALRDIFSDRPDLLPSEFLDDLQQVNGKIVNRLANVSSKERELRRNQVLH